MESSYEQSNRKCAHLERILIVCGDQNAGKSSLLRSMFIDPRFGTGRKIPSTRRIKPVALSKERGLFVRCTSPHEANETIGEFLDKIEDDLKRGWSDFGFWRANYACAVQPLAYNKMPDVVKTCEEITKAFCPERIRLIQINPRQDFGVVYPRKKTAQAHSLSHQHIDDLRKFGVEVITLDGRRHANGVEDRNAFLLSSYFDFT